MNWWIDELINWWIDELMNWCTGCSDKEVLEEDKYSRDFFYIAPFYHLAFTSLTTVIFLDCFDLGTV